MATNLKWPSVLALLLVAGMVGIASAGNIAVYWGQNVNEGTLADACSSGSYAYVIISFLSTFGSGQAPVLNLAGHCNPGECAGLASDIQSCKSQGVRVLLSLGGAGGNYGLSSTDDANSVADYLWDNFLGGTGSTSRPLGAVALDGIDLDIENGNPAHYDELASALKAKDGGVLLTAAPQCPYPDASLGPALQTGLFDAVWVQFYNNPGCAYAGGDDANLVAAWRTWTGGVRAGSFYLGLPASEEAAGSGYIPPGDLTGTVLPAVQGVGGGYGGIMLWSRYYDVLKNPNYSDQVKGSV
ncbi:acidic endochitinase Pun g 14, amyloplastic-like [Panicum virgatum]|uniref:chitinase n=1 Tax=Panicum virgatum TaxID=38727 RepID=A0A8T0SLX6_PANVG|nr:acidic endochitinase Pun g 14, amyloplastic-like [Panicum virgatum]KAG2599571.1 hypothetical protein PVAP13_5KG447000 [Panicum virgatum]